MENNNNAIAVNLKTKLLKCLELIRKYDWLINAYVLDFYVEDHWENLSECWRDFLAPIQPEDLSDLLKPSTNGKLWPLSLLSLRQLLRDLCISRELAIDNNLPIGTLLVHPKLKHIFTKCVKPKKRHEIERMAAICKQHCLKTPVDFVVDFGAGLGHLARVLGYGFGISVCCLEMQEKLNKQAEVIDLQLECIAAKHLNSSEINHFQRPTHVTLCLTATMEAEEFLLIISKALQLPNKNFRFGIIGLHPCGDLGAILMRMFLNCEQAKFLNFVGCCYMKLTTPATQDIASNQNKFGYPLSKYLQEKSIHLSSLSYEAREISCHALEIYCDRLLSCDYEYLKVHSYRAATERIIIEHWPELKHCGLRSVKHTQGLKFQDYFCKAVQGVIPNTLSSNELQSKLTTSDLLHWQYIVIFYTLRLMFAPLVESVILYDRILYLQENNCEVKINAIFDPRLSPRNHITSAIKRSA